MRNRMRITRAGRVGGFLSVIVLAAACSGGPSEPKAAERKGPPAVPVAVAAVEKRDTALTVQAIGTVEAYSVVAVRAQVGGELQRVHIKEGQDVRKGDLLFTIDPRPQQAAVAQAEAVLA